MALRLARLPAVLCILTLAGALNCALCQSTDFRPDGLPGAEHPQNSDDALEHWRRATVSVGQVVQDGVSKRYITIGSAVLIVTYGNRAILVTAKHVFFDPSRGYVPTSVRIRLPQSQPNSPQDLGIEVPLRYGEVTLWRSLPDGSDIAGVELPPDIAKYKTIHAVSIRDFATPEDVYQGAQIIILGYPAILGEDFLSSLIARAGIVAWTDPNGSFDRRFLVDANIFNGNSGGPVFHVRNGLNKQGSLTLGGGYALMGIVVADAFENAQVSVGDQPVRGVDSRNGQINPATAKVLNIGGIGIVEPSSKIKQLTLSMIPLESQTSPP